MFSHTSDNAQIGYSSQGITATGSEAYSEANRIEKTRQEFYSFLKEFRIGEVFIYRERLAARYEQGQHDLEVNFQHLNKANQKLAEELYMKPDENFSLFEKAAAKLIYDSLPRIQTRPSLESMPRFQIKLKNYQRNETLRGLDSRHITQLVRVKGVIISAFKVRAKATRMKIRCQSCNNSQTIQCKPGFGRVDIPRVCTARGSGDDDKCQLDPYVFVTDESEFMDVQQLRLQELTTDTPPGEMPRHITIATERNMVNKLSAGSKVHVTGIYSIFKQKQMDRNAKSRDIRFPYLRVVGIQPIEDELNLEGESGEEEEELKQLAASEDVYEKLAASLAPKIFGHEDVKKAIVCLLFGGSRKELPSKVTIRGDLNVLLLGDPSVAKSQMLKCTTKTAPIAVYTSGKGSSAAGLTAAVIRDQTGEFHLEGGAMVIADGGVVAIDEFDKMRDDDRVAIHEAMEQQTISIAKAGITTILNSRTSVLAAANPTFGRYNDNKKATENIDFETTILSRFDLIFIVRDKRDEAKDRRLASHILNIHMNKQAEDEHKAPITAHMFKRFISYARHNCEPRLNPRAAALLKDHYVNFRKDARKRQEEYGTAAIPITVRQLEAIIRISESLAKMRLSSEANEDDVKEAIRLAKVATMAAAAAGPQNTGGPLPDQFSDEGTDFVQSVQKAETHLLRRLPHGGKMRVKRLVDEMVARNHNENAVQKAIHNFVARGQFELRNQGRMVSRK